MSLLKKNALAIEPNTHKSHFFQKITARIYVVSDKNARTENTQVQVFFLKNWGENRLRFNKNPPPSNQPGADLDKKNCMAKSIDLDQSVRFDLFAAFAAEQELTVRQISDVQFFYRVFS